MLNSNFRKIILDINLEFGIGTRDFHAEHQFGDINVRILGFSYVWHWKIVKLANHAGTGESILQYDLETFVKK